MEIIILSPNLEGVITPEQKKILFSLGDVKIISDIKPFNEVAELKSRKEKIVAIDPDFCDWNLTADNISVIFNCKSICLQTTSFSWVDIEYAKAVGIQVYNLVDWCTDSVAEWMLMETLCIARNIPTIIQNNWKYDIVLNRGIELFNKKAGIIGLGDIGTKMAELCKGIGMDVQYWSKNSRDKRFKYVELEDLMKTSDVIYFTFAKNEESRKLISDDLLESVKQGVIIVSAPIHIKEFLNEELLFKIVKEKKIYGLGTEDEDYKIPDLKGNIWTGVRMGWCTDESMNNNTQRWIESIEGVLKGELKGVN